MEEQNNVIVCIIAIVIVYIIARLIVKHFFPKIWKKYFDD